jgi:hypothetical protein
MNTFLQRIRKRSRQKKRKEHEWPLVNIEAQIEAIRKIEADEDIGLGRRIHCFACREFELSLDRDIMGTYRVIAYQGKERRYSFSVTCPHKDYEALQAAFEEIVQYLSGDHRLADLPNNEGMKGHYFGP